MRDFRCLFNSAGCCNFTNKISIFNWMLTQFFFSFLYAMYLKAIFIPKWILKYPISTFKNSLSMFSQKYFFILTRDFFSFWGKFFISSIDFLLQSLSTHTRMGFKVPRFSAREINTIFTAVEGYQINIFMMKISHGELALAWKSL